MHPRAFGPRPRDDRAARSTARLASGTFLPAPPYTATPPAGRTVSVGGHGIYLRHVPGPAGTTPTWYIHGLEGTSRNWDRLAAVLSDRSGGYAPDLPGSGWSAPPRRGYSLAGESELVARLIRRIGGSPVHLVGNSRGGFVATLLAAHHPELVRTLTLISPAVPDFRVIRERGADARLVLVMLPGAAVPVRRMLGSIAPQDRARALALTCFGEPAALTDADLAAAAQEFADRKRMPWATESVVESLRSLIRAQLRRGRDSFTAAARSVAAPTLVVWGTRDRLVDCRLAEPTAALFRDGRLLMLERTGHVAQMERPESVARAMVALWQDAAVCDRVPGAADAHGAASAAETAAVTAAYRRADAAAVATPHGPAGLRRGGGAGAPRPPAQPIVAT